MMSEDITRKKLTKGMSWVQRFSRARPASLLSSSKYTRAVINRKYFVTVAVSLTYHAHF